MQMVPSKGDEDFLLLHSTPHPWQKEGGRLFSPFHPLLNARREGLNGRIFLRVPIFSYYSF